MTISTGDISNDPAASAAGIGLDQLFRYAAAQRPDALALIDPPDREQVTGGAPRSLTYAQADRAISAIAARLSGLGLAAGDIVGLQMPNTVEGVLALLGILRAGLVAAPLPLLWRRADCTAALTPIRAKALLTACRVGAIDYADNAIQTAAAVTTVRHVGLFGGTRDGAISFDDGEGGPAADFAPARRNDADAALITFDVTAAGLVPVIRSHGEVTLAGYEIMHASALAAGTVIVSPLCLGSLTGVAATVAIWLMSRGTLVLHHPFDPGILRHQIGAHGAGAVVMPGSLAHRCAEAGMFSGGSVGKVIVVWRAPERLAACGAWPGPSGGSSAGPSAGQGPEIIDLMGFGEIGFAAAMRGPDRKPAGIKPKASARATRGAQPETRLTEAMRTDAGTLALRGPMVPQRALRPAPAARQASGTPAASPDGFVDTGYPCRFSPSSGTLVVTAPPPGVVAVGGYRLALAALQEAVSQIEMAAIVAAFPDRLTGQRIAGVSAQREDIQRALAERGHNPLAINAFRPPRKDTTRSAA